MDMRLLLPLPASLRECASADPFCYLYRAFLRLFVSKGGAHADPGPRPGPQGGGRARALARRPLRPARRVVESLWSAAPPLTRAREGGNVSPCR